jgi:serine/threonine protein kinase
MERLGENLAELRKQCTGGVFTMSTSIRLGIQMIEALEGIHKLGFIHRDVKPVRFVHSFTDILRVTLLWDQKIIQRNEGVHI